MSLPSPLTPPWRGNLVRASSEQDAWLASRPAEAPLCPHWPMVDAHHHLMLAPDHGVQYGVHEALADIAVTGQTLLGTVQVESGTRYHRHAPAALQSVGEAEFAREVRVQSRALSHTELAMAFVGHADLSLGEAVAPVLDALQSASDGRLRGIRHATVHDSGEVGKTLLRPCPPGLLLTSAYQQGVAQVRERGLVLDVWVFHHQLHEVLSLARRFDDLVIVLNHLGTPLGVAEYAPQTEAVRVHWQHGLRELATCPNVHIKIGGQGMPLAGWGFCHAATPPDSLTLAARHQAAWHVVLDTFGPGRGLCGSNFPIDRQSWGLDVIWNTWQRLCLPLSPDERWALLCGNTARTYALPLPPDTRQAYLQERP